MVMKKIFASILCGVVVLAGLTNVVRAEGEEMSDELKGAISVNCGSIVKQLQNVRYYDRRAREYLGNRYEKVLTSYVTNLNVRLVKNNISNARLQELQVALAESHAGFKNEYGKYATEMNELIGMNCVTEPEGFYVKLGQVRARRVNVRRWTEKMSEGLDKYRDEVADMRDLL